MLSFNTRSDNLKFKLSEEAREYFKIDSQYLTKKSFEWYSSTCCHITCDIVSEQFSSFTNIER